MERRNLIVKGMRLGFLAALLAVTGLLLFGGKTGRQAECFGSRGCGGCALQPRCSRSQGNNSQRYGKRQD